VLPRCPGNLVEQHTNKGHHSLGHLSSGVCWKVYFFTYTQSALAADLYSAKLKNRCDSQALEVHTYNPSCSGGRDQEDRGSKPAWANSSRDPILKNPSHTKKNSAGGGAQGEGLVQAPIP
jgi:hypothetical protein